MQPPVRPRPTFLSAFSTNPPRLRVGEADNEPRHATWLELFYDLVFVVAVSQLAHKLSGDVSITGFLCYAGLFVPLWWTWVGTTFYATRFDSDDPLRRLMMGLQMLAIAALAVNVHHAWSTTSFGFALSYIISRVLLIVEYMRVAKHIPPVRSLVYPMSTGFGVGVLFWIISLAVPVPWRFVLWGIGLIVDFISPIVVSKRQIEWPPHAEHLPERFGLFTIIVLGEAVIAVVNGLSEMNWGLSTAVTASLGFVVAFSIWWLYFENVSGRALENAREAGKSWIVQVWLYGHLPLVIAIAAVGIGVEHLVTATPGEILPGNERWLMAGTVALYYLALAILHRTGVIFSCKVRTRHRLGAAAAMMAIAIFGVMLTPMAVMGAIAFVGIIQVSLDILQKQIGLSLS